MVLTKEEIKKIKDAVVIITLEDAIQILETGKIKIITPVLLKSGYRVGYSIEHMRLAKDFLGDGYESIGSMNVKNVLHFMRLDKVPNNDY